jgi:hypothetical protein
LVKTAVIGVLLVRHSRHQGYLLLTKRPYHTRARIVRQLQGCPAHTALVVFVRAGDYNHSLEDHRRSAGCCGLHATGHAIGSTRRGTVLTEP